jgi:hypothetical protein
MFHNVTIKICLANMLLLWSVDYITNEAMTSRARLPYLPFFRRVIAQAAIDRLTTEQGRWRDIYRRCKQKHITIVSSTTADASVVLLNSHSAGDLRLWSANIKEQKIFHSLSQNGSTWEKSRPSAWKIYYERKKVQKESFNQILPVSYALIHHHHQQQHQEYERRRKK